MKLKHINIYMFLDYSVWERAVQVFKALVVVRRKPYWFDYLLVSLGSDSLRGMVSYSCYTCVGTYTETHGGTRPLR